VLKLLLAICCVLAACGTSTETSRPAPGAFPSGRLPSPTAAAGSAAPSLGTGVAPVVDNPGGVLPPVAAAAPNPGGCNQDVDIVFSLDVSGSMTPSLTKLADEVGKVDEALKTKNLPSPPHYGLVIFVDDVLLMQAGAPYTDLESLKTEVRNQADLANANSSRQIDPNGINFSWPENSLDALFATTQFQWRPTATTLRIVFHITDASFWDGVAPSSGADSEKQIAGLEDAMSTHHYQEVIEALRAQHIWVNTFAAKTGGPPDGMTAPPSHGTFRGISVDVGIGFFEPYMSQKSIPDATGGTAWDLDDVYDGKISLGTPIQMSIEARQCVEYPM
jgi:hypothetical protein